MRSRRLLDGLSPAPLVTAHVVVAFVALVLPTAFSASGDIVELSVTSTDAPLVYQQLLQMIGPGPTTKSYGDFLPVVLAYGTAPLRWLAHLLGLEISHAFYIVLFRLSQIACAALTFLGLYRLTAALSSPWMGCFAVAIVATMIEITDLTVVLHPDIWQLMAELFCLTALISAHRHCVAAGWLPVRAVILAAIWTGAATASKINGIFIAPSIAVVFLGPLLYKRDGFTWQQAVMEIVRASTIFLVVFFPVTAALWPMLVSDPVALFAFFKAVSVAFEGLSMWQGIVLLTPEKLATLLSSKMAGPFVVPLYVLGLAIAGARWLRRPAIASDPLIVLHASIIFSLAYYLLVFRDTFNVYGSERYILFAVILMLVVVLVWAWRLTRTRAKAIGAAAITVLLVWQCAQATGYAGVSGLTALYPAVFRSMFVRYGWVTHEEPLAERLRNAYRYEKGATSFILRDDLTPAERADATAIRRLVVGEPTFFSGDFAILPYIRRFAHAEDMAGFKIRKWVADHIPDGKSIVVEYYMNLRDSAQCKCNRTDAGTRKFVFDNGEIYAAAGPVRTLRPDYILTRRKTVAARLLREFSSYELMAVVEGSPTNLLDDAESGASIAARAGASTASLKAYRPMPVTAEDFAAGARAADQHPPSVVFVLRRIGDGS